MSAAHLGPGLACHTEDNSLANRRAVTVYTLKPSIIWAFPTEAAVVRVPPCKGSVVVHVFKR
jgi:hypothetical protein